MNDRLRYEEREKIKALADQISSFVNSASRPMIEALGQELAHDHRTLVQSKGNMVLAFLSELKTQNDEGRTDLRNQAICEWAAKALKDGTPCLPYV